MKPPRIDHTLSIDDTRALLGQHQPKVITRTGAKPVCAACGGHLTWIVEYSARCPHGTGYDVLICEECRGEVDRHWAGW